MSKHSKRADQQHGTKTGETRSTTTSITPTSQTRRPEGSSHWAAKGSYQQGQQNPSSRLQGQTPSSPTANKTR